MKKVKKNPSRLHPFDQLARDYFEEKKATTYEEHIENIESELQAFKAISTMFSNYKKEMGDVGLSHRAIEKYVWISRENMSTLKVYVTQFQKHLEQIDMTGEWK